MTAGHVTAGHVTRVMFDLLCSRTISRCTTASTVCSLTRGSPARKQYTSSPGIITISGHVTRGTWQLYLVSDTRHPAPPA